MAKAARNVASEQKPFCKRLLSLAGKYSIWEVWSDFINVFALAISNSVDKVRFDEREALYRRIMAKYDAKEREVFPLLAADVVSALEQNPEQDFLGSAYMELELGNDHAGQFFTPYDVCRLMAEVSVPRTGSAGDSGWLRHVQRLRLRGRGYTDSGVSRRGEEAAATRPQLAELCAGYGAGH